jgi:hypothetical protein
MTQATQNTQVEKNVIEEVLEVIDLADLNVLESAKQIEDVNLRRNTIAEHLISVAHNSGLLKSVKSPSTMRERVYSVLATKTSDSKKMYLKLGMTKDVLDTVNNVAAVIEANAWRIK